MKFYVDLSDGAQPIEQREIVFNATAQARSPSGRVAGHRHAAGAPDDDASTGVLLDDVARAGPRARRTIPVFRYYAYNRAVPPRPTRSCLPTPLSRADLARVAKIELGFITLPPGGQAHAALVA